MVSAFCRSCGGKFEEADRFCGACGAGRGSSGGSEATADSAPTGLPPEPAAFEFTVSARAEMNYDRLIAVLGLVTSAAYLATWALRLRSVTMNHWFIEFAVYQVVALLGLLIASLSIPALVARSAQLVLGGNGDELLVRIVVFGSAVMSLLRLAALPGMIVTNDSLNQVTWMWGDFPTNVGSGFLQVLTSASVAATAVGLVALVLFVVSRQLWETVRFMRPSTATWTMSALITVVLGLDLYLRFRSPFPLAVGLLSGVVVGLLTLLPGDLGQITAATLAVFGISFVVASILALVAHAIFFGNGSAITSHLWQAIRWSFIAGICFRRIGGANGVKSQFNQIRGTLVVQRGT